MAFRRLTKRRLIHGAQWHITTGSPQTSLSRSTADGAGPADVVPFRMDPELSEAIAAHAEAEHTPTSEIIRRTLRWFLEVA